MNSTPPLSPPLLLSRPNDQSPLKKRAHRRWTGGDGIKKWMITDSSERMRTKTVNMILRVYSNGPDLEEEVMKESYLEVPKLN